MELVIVTHKRLFDLYTSWLKNQFTSFATIFIEPGEASKTRQTKESVEDQMFQLGCTRKTKIVGFGGGVILDLVGFVASTFMRGIDCIFVPTTLLAMVDASIGGKNGIDTPFGKNMVGTFYLPKRVIFDPIFLNTLSDHEQKCGFVEMCKIALIHDAAFFEELIYPPSEKMIQKAIQLKQMIVEKDPFDCFERKLLNFGHTFGHAVEALSNYTISHGLAVNMGILFEVFLSNLPENEIEKIANKLPFKPPFQEFDPIKLSLSMKKDKKQDEQTAFYTFIVLEKIGKACIKSISYSELDQAFKRYHDHLNS